jgi:hypothetical protein
MPREGAVGVPADPAALEAAHAKRRAEAAAKAAALAAAALHGVLRSAPAAHVVVARYNEDAAWLARLAPALRPGERIFVYDKGAPLAPGAVAGAALAALPNVGREAHTYLHHVVAHWDALPALLFFAQGCISDRNHAYNDAPAAVRARFLDLPPAAAGSANFSPAPLSCWLTNGRITSYAGGALTPVGAPVWEWFAATMRRPDVDARARLPMSLGAIFSVRADAVKKRPLAFYVALRDQLAAAGNHAELAHFLERAWYYVFSMDGGEPAP